MRRNTYKLALTTAAHPEAGTDAEVWLRFLGDAGKTEWMSCADHEYADIRGRLQSGATLHATIQLPEIGDISACCLVLRGASGEHWQPESVEISSDKRSCVWMTSSRLTSDCPVVWYSPAVLTRDLPDAFEATVSERLCQAVTRMADIQLQWETNRQNAISPAQAVNEILAIMDGTFAERKSGGD